MKICSKCLKDRPLSEFWKRSSNRDGLHVWCKKCAGDSHQQWVERNRTRSNEIKRNWCARNPEKSREIARRSYRANRRLILDRSRQKSYGISPIEFKMLLSKQGGVCAICKCKPGAKEFHVDHDHVSRSVRGILCGHCNLALGHLKDSPALAAAASVYLNAHIISQYCVGISNQKQKE